jgi:hypothetical protein
MMGIKYKLVRDGKTADVSLRVSSIANGWVIKAGGKPFFVNTEEELLNAVRELLVAYTKETSALPKETP